MKRIICFLFFYFLFCSFSLAKINISAREVDLGKIIQGKPIDYVFYIENQSSRPLHIKKIIPD